MDIQNFTARRDLLLFLSLPQPQMKAESIITSKNSKEIIWSGLMMFLFQDQHKRFPDIMEISFSGRM